MITFSADPDLAEEQMRAVILYLAALGYVDECFDEKERAFVRAYIRTLVEHRVDASKPASAALRAEQIERYTAHFLEVFEGLDAWIQAQFTEAVAQAEDLHRFVYSRVKLRCYEIFHSLDEDSRARLLETVDEFIAADGVVHPHEKQFRDELAALLAVPIPVSEAEIEEVEPAHLEIREPTLPVPRIDDHPFLQRLESHYSRDPGVLREQAAFDHQLVNKAIAKFEELAAAGAGRLDGKQTVDQLACSTPFLDRHVNVLMPPPDQAVDLLVLGDLHGCYSCLKAALLQWDFFNRVQRYRDDPAHNPDVKLVLLGDYIDRGMYSYNGVLRTVLQAFLTAPEHVYPLRGNHEYYVEYKGRIFGGVRPAEAILTLEPYAPKELFSAYMKLFETLPHALLFDRFLFVHAGIPRDALFAERWKDLASLNDPDIRFQMLWSDPSEADFVPRELQEESARFSFGRLQFRSFMAHIGANTMVRGHTKLDEGFKRVIDDDVVVLLNLFSAGGQQNDDLPPDSSYRSVRPMALEIKRRPEGNTVTPWAIDYERYNSPDRNAFFKMPPEIEFKSS